MSMDYKKFIRDIPDYPKPGIIFKDITTMLKAPVVFTQALKDMVKPFAAGQVDKVLGIESRGFIFGAPIAQNLSAGFVPVRKEGKLPANRLSQEYTLEYGSSKVEIHTDAIEKGERVLIVDDVLATGGTAEAVCRLVERMGGQVMGLTFFIELDFLKGRQKFAGKEIFSLVRYA